MKTRILVRLKRVELDADFRRSEKTMFDELPKSFRRSMRGHDAVCFVSKMKNQVVFVYRGVGVGARRNGRVEILASVRLRLSHGRWDPSMLSNYAAECGLELEGLPLLEERWDVEAA